MSSVALWSKQYHWKQICTEFGLSMRVDLKMLDDATVLGLAGLRLFTSIVVDVQSAPREPSARDIINHVSC